MSLNKKWHDKHSMPVDASETRRIKWHIAHAKHCGCRPIPPKLLEIIENRNSKS
jgi:hypothetical protein